MNFTEHPVLNALKRFLSRSATQASDSNHNPVLMAFGEAMIPGSDRVARFDEHSLAKTEDMLEHIAPEVWALWKSAVHTLDKLAVAYAGKPFHKLSHERQDAVLATWYESPRLRPIVNLLAFAVKFAHFDVEAVYKKMGGRLNVVDNVETPRYLQQIIDSETHDDEIPECDVLVIGTGAGGAVVGKELAEKGYAVVFIEEGAFHTRKDFTGSSIQAHKDFYRGAMGYGNAPMPVFMGRLVGGSTAINTGSSWRTPPWVLHRWCEETNSDEFSPTNMARHFDRVERIIELMHPERKYVGPIQDIIARGSDALGWNHLPVPRNAPGCQGEGFCDFGCRTDARKSTNLSYIPPALMKGSMLFTKLRAEQILIENGRAVGVVGKTKNGKTFEFKSRIVILAGGAVPSPMLLMKQGICNSSGQLGRNLSLHPSTAMAGIYDDVIRGPHHIPSGYAVDEFLRDGLLLTVAQGDYNVMSFVFPFVGKRLMSVLNQADHIANFGILARDEKASGRVLTDRGGTMSMYYSLDEGDIKRLHTGFIKTAELAFEAGAKTLYPSLMSFPEIKGRDDFKRFKNYSLKPSDFMLASYHPQGTAKMGRDPKTSVVDLDYQTHDVPGLYVVDASVISGPIGVNTQLTTMAHANRAAECIAQHLS